MNPEEIGYAESIRKYKNLRETCYAIFYALYNRDNPDFTVQEITEKIMQSGINSYNDQVNESCSNLDDVVSDMQSILPNQTETDIETAVMDLGIQYLSKELYDADSAHDFVKKYMGEYKKLLEKINESEE